VRDDKEKGRLLALVGVLSGSDEDFEMLIEETRKIRKPREMRDLVELLADAGKTEQARQIAGEMHDQNSMFHAYIYIASKSNDGRDFQSAISAMETDDKADEIDKRSMLSKTIAALSKAKKYEWAYILAKDAKFRDEEMNAIAAQALEAEDYFAAFRFAMEADEAKIASDVISAFIEKGDIDNARALADKLTGICDADYFRAYAYLSIELKTNDEKDYQKAYAAALLSCKNDSKVYSSNLLMDFAITKMDRHLAGIACDKALGGNFKEVSIEKLAHNLRAFKTALEKKLNK